MEKPHNPKSTHIEKATTIPEDFDPALDKRLNRKFDMRILPWLFGIWYSQNISSLDSETHLTQQTNKALLLHRPLQHRQRPHSRPHHFPLYHNRHALQHRPARLLHPLHPRRRTLKPARQAAARRHLLAHLDNRLGSGMHDDGVCEELCGACGV